MRSVSTDCTANANIWGCFPDNIFDPSDDNSFASRQVIFEVVISKTSTYWRSMVALPEGEIVATNLTISSRNPFNMPFKDKPLAYAASTSNSSSARLQWAFTTNKEVMPSAALTSNNAATQYPFSGTTDSGTLFLSADREYRSSEGASYELSPHAVEVRQSAEGGENVPTCFEPNSGRSGERVPPEPQGDGAIFECVWRNY